ncbi:hypothetical protein [Actinoplanes philippinensis]|uniref:hypothetical protein n=1 Tax=Actinoplanes philippinensis TaxID=35752 RepID=UPI00340EF96A
MAATAFAHHRHPAARDTATVWEFTVRLTGGERLPVTLRTDAPRGALRPRDHVRLIPARHTRRGAVKAVEILATPTGPILHRITASPTLPPVQRAGLLLAALLLAATAATLLTA